MHSYTLFALHTCAPYVRMHVTYEHAEFKHKGTGRAFGSPNFMTSLSKLYAADYRGPFTIGVQCTAAAQAS